MQKHREIEIDVKGLARYLAKRWLAIVAAVLVSMLLAFSVSSLAMTPVYESQSMIYITTGSGGSVVQNMLSTLQAGNALTADYKTLATSKPVLEQVIADLGLDTTYEELREKVSTENPEDTRILTLKVRDTDPEKAKVIVDKLTEIERDKIADIMNTTKPNVMQWGDIPLSPVSTSPKRMALNCGFIVLLIVLALMSVRFVLNDTIVTAEDIEDALDLRNLAEIPMIAKEGGNRKSTKRFKWRKK